MDITGSAAKFIVDTKLEKVPQEAVAAAKRSILDCIGVTLAGSTSEAGKVITQFVRAAGAKPIATVVNGGFQTSAPYAALANGTMGHALDYDDYGDSMGHPSVLVVPVLLALGEQESISGKEALEAYLVGFELESKLGRVVGRGLWDRGFHRTATLGAMGAAAAASKLLRLDIEKTRMALAIAGSEAGGLKQQFGTMMKPFHAGMSARSGVVAAMLAKKGFTGDRNILEAPLGFCKVLGETGTMSKALLIHIESLADSLGHPFDIVSPGISIKRHSCGGANHPAIDAMLELADTYGLSPDNVESIEVRVIAHIEAECFHHQPKTALEGKFSLEFTVSMALLEHAVRLAQFTDEKVLAPKTQELMRKTKVVVHEPTDSDPDAVIVLLRDGRRCNQPMKAPRGSPANPMSDEDLIAKYRDCAQLVLSKRDINRSIKLVQNLEQLASIRQLTNLLA